MHPEFTPKDIERFWSKVDRSGGPDVCWPWMTGRFNGGYGQFSLNGRPIGAHRVAFALTHGRWAEPMTLHTCDNDPCCNPNHLYEGTHADNMTDRDVRDRTAKGERHGWVVCPERMPKPENHPAHRDPTWSHGEKNGRAKLTAENVHEIRTLYAAGGHSYQSLSSFFNVSKPNIAHIITGYTWNE